MNDIALVNQTTGKVRWGYVLGYLLLFLVLPPVVGLSLVVSMLWKKPNATKSDYYLLFFCVAAYFSAINATKTPTGDQVNYYVAFTNVPTLGFWKSLVYIYGLDYYKDPTNTQISGEFMNGIYNFIGYYITFGQYYIFVFLYSLIEYMLIFVGLYKYCQSLKSPHLPIVCGVLILGFFYLFFQYIFQIQKQFFAQAIIMYVLGSLSQEMKMTPKLWLVTAIALFTHATMIIFIPFIAYKKLRQPLTKNTLLILGGLFMALVYFAPSLVGTMTTRDTAGTAAYSLGRVANAELDDDGGSLVMSQVIVVGIPIAMIVLKQLWFNRKRLTSHASFILNVVLLLLLAVVAMSRQIIAQYRYFMMIFAFMPFVYPHAFNNVKTRNIFLTALAFIMVVWFYGTFENIIYDFAPEWAIISVPPTGLVFGFNPDL